MRGEPIERELHAQEAHASATLLALLLTLWGAISVAVMPTRFRIVDGPHLVVGTLALAWFLATRRRPRIDVAYAFSALAVVDALAVLPWITVTWCALGRPFEAVTVPQVAMLCMALVVPRSLRLALVTVALFLGDGLFVTVYADHVGLHARLPVGEPFTTLAFALPAVGLILLRHRRRRLAGQHRELRAEAASLGWLGPLFARVRSELAAELAAIAPELPPDGEDAPTAERMQRAAGQLREVSQQLDELAGGDDDAQRAAAAAEVAALERQLLDRDAQLGAVVFTALAASVAFLFAPVMATQVGGAEAVDLTVVSGAALAALALLLRARSRPSERLSRGAVLVVFAIALIASSLNQYAMVATGRPFTPFIGHKLIMVILGLTVASWSKLGLPLIFLTAAVALAQWFELDLGALRDRIDGAEPAVTMVFLIIGVAALMLRDQRRLASLALLRDEAETAALHRRARLLLTLRDRLNTPVQTLVIGSAHLALGQPRDRARLDAAVARLVALSRELATLEVPSASHAATLGGGELERAARLKRRAGGPTVPE